MVAGQGQPTTPFVCTTERSKKREKQKALSDISIVIAVEYFNKILTEHIVY